MKKEIKFRFTFCLTLTLLLISYWAIEVEKIGLRFNKSSSLPYTLFLSKKNHASPKKGDIVSIEHPLIEGRLAKIVAGIPGDYISADQGDIAINEQLLGRIKDKSSSGKYYHPITETLIPENHYFLLATHPESFDSRYQEFGLVKQEWIKEDLWPIY